MRIYSTKNTFSLISRPQIQSENYKMPPLIVKPSLHKRVHLSCIVVHKVYSCERLSLPFLPNACIAAYSPVKASSQGEDSSLVPAWFLWIMQSKSGVSSTIGSCHLVSVCYQEGWQKPVLSRGQEVWQKPALSRGNSKGSVPHRHQNFYLIIYAF